MSGELVCTSCKAEKDPLTDYYLKQGQIRQPCKTCIQSSSKKWKAKNKKHCARKRRRYYLDNRTMEISRACEYFRKKTYGVTPEQYVAMLKEQDAKCAICGIDSDLLTKGLHIDHNHETGAIRGLLCHNCNTAVLRTVETYSHLVPVATKYLEKYRV